MSWNTASIVLSRQAPGYLGTSPPHDPNRAREYLQQLDIRPGQQSRFATWEAGISPPSGWFCIGAYDGALLLSGVDQLFGAVENPDHSFLRRLFSAMPGATALVFELAGAVNHFGYALYVNGELQRAFGGDADRGIVVSEGEPLPEEALYLGRHVARPGQRDMPWTNAQSQQGTDVVSLGETLTFVVAGRFFGQKLDEFESERLQVELVKKAGTGFLARLLNRR